MNKDQLIITTLTKLVQEELKQGVYGHIIKGLPQLPISELLEALSTNFDACSISLIGQQEPQSEIEKSASKWSNLNIGFNATHAVNVRNSDPLHTAKITFAWEEESRLGSLTQRGYKYIDPEKLMKSICSLGATNSINEPQKNLWLALNSDEISPYLSLEGILDFYLALFSTTKKINSINPRKALVHLLLLPDSELLSGKYTSEETIKQRLLTNIKTMAQIQRADQDDRNTVIETIKINASNTNFDLKKLYSAFLRISDSDFQALQELELSVVLLLLSGKIFPDQASTGEGPPNEDISEPEHTDNPDNDDDILSPDEDSDDSEDSPTPNGNSTNINPKISYSIEEAAIRFAIINQSNILKQILDNAQKSLKDSKFEQHSLPLINFEGKKYDVTFHPEVAAISLNSMFTHVTLDQVIQQRYGGEISVENDGIKDIIKNLGNFSDRSTFYDEIYLSKFKAFLENCINLAPQLKALDLLNEYLELRNSLVEFNDFLATAPLTCLITNNTLLNNVINYITKYEEILNDLALNYKDIYEKSPDGAKKLYSDLLTLDTIKIVNGEEISIILTALNPLVLWKYAELAKLITSRSNRLPVRDVKLLLQEIQHLPEPLLTFFSAKGKNKDVLAFSHRIGSLPVYSQNEIENSDLSKKTLEISAQKLANLYPHVRENLRVLLVDPVSTIEVSKSLRNLTKKSRFKKITLLLANLSNNNNNNLPYDANLKELSQENKVEIEVLSAKSMNALNKYLNDKPVHILGFSGLRSKSIGKIETENTRLHPLSVPHRIHADPLLSTITLRPRSLSGENEGIVHPFSGYHKIVAELTGQQNSEASIEEHNTLPINEIKELMPFSQFVLVSGSLSDINRIPDLLRLSQNLEISGDSVFTFYKNIIIGRLDKQLKKFNYTPHNDGISRLIQNLQDIGGEGLFSIITDKGQNGLLESAVKGLLGVAVALSWYKNETDNQNSIVISLDSNLAKKWLYKREEKERSDYIGIRQLEDSSYVIDILEVKGYEATTDTNILSSHPVKQLRSIASIIYEMTQKQGDLFTDRRRELLRLQIFKEALQFANIDNLNWIQDLNGILDGDIPVKMNLKLIEVSFDQNIALEVETFTSNTEGANTLIESLPITRVRMGEQQIQQYLENYAHKNAHKKPSANDASESSNDSNSNTDKENILGDIEKSNEIIDEELSNQNPESVSNNINSNVAVNVGKIKNGSKDILWNHSRTIEDPLSNHNIIITGDPGKGKTQTIKGLLFDLRKNNIPVLIMDFKDDYVDKEFLEAEGLEMFDIMSKGLPFNPLIPSPDKDTNTFIAINHIVQIEGILKRIYKLGIQQASQLRAAMIEAFNRNHIRHSTETVFDTSLNFPNFDDVYHILLEDEKKHSTLIGRLDLLFQIGIFPANPLINFEALMQGSYTLRLTKLPNDEIKAAVAEIMILAMHNHFSSKEHPRKLTRAIVLDEAHRISESDILATFARECRAFGISIIIATQFPTDMSGEIYGCTETKLFLGNDDPKHAEAAAEKIEGSSVKERMRKTAEIIRNLGQFHAIIRNAHYKNEIVEISAYYKKAENQ